MNAQVNNSISSQDLALLSSTQLWQLQEQTNTQWQQLKQFKERLQIALELKYKDIASVNRIRQGKDCGIVHFEDEGVQITANLPKKVSWDHPQLVAIAQRIQAGGDDPQQYLEVTYKVSEKRYSSWPQSIRAVFQPARTFATGLQTFTLEQGEQA